MSLESGTRLGHYVLAAPLGSGGMGEVYRATDTRLDRAVALKVLPADVTSQADRLERFQREAKVLAALDHPNIVTVFSVEEVAAPAGGGRSIHFLTMQLVEGQSLEQLIPPGGLPLDRVLQIAPAVAEALVAAHDRGIVHRDLKPANVMVAADGRVKVLDFGLAKELGASGPADATRASAGHTEQGVVMGTPAYMSPEQLAGRTVDHRSDLFSLGVMLYQMASGRRPFDGASSIELASAILRDTPAALTDLRAEVPAGLERLIHRCLEKDPRRRIQSARDVAHECRDLARHAVSVVTPAAVRQPAAIGSVLVRQDEGFWVAVLPFKHTGANADLAVLAEGLTEEIVTGLSRFSYLRVIARSSSSQYSAASADVRSVGKAIGARYVMDGSLRQAGTQLRAAVQLVDTATGAHLWAETYNRRFDADGLFALQDDLVPRIVSTVADWYGVLPRSMSEAVRSKPVESLSPYESLLRAFGYFERVTPEEHAVVRPVLERAVEQAPGHAAAWAMLSMIYGEEHRFGWNVLPDPLGRALQAARRAADAAPTSHVSHLALAQAHYFRKEFDAFRNAAERAIALNPMDGATVEYLGHLLAFAGDWERGCDLGEKARLLNPNHPAWYWALPFLDAYRRRDYEAARTLVPKAYMPGQHYSMALFAALRGQLGEHAAADETVRELLTLKPDFAQVARELFAKWYQSDLVEHLIDGLRKAGLDMPAVAPVASSTPPSPRSAAPDSGAARADEGFWVAVLPFRGASANPDVAALADGMSEALISGLSNFSYLRVIARSSTERYTREPADVRTVGSQIGARYVMEGTLRQAGSQLRVAAQLVDATTGAQLWSETYDRPFSSDAIFALQDDLVPRIVATVADGNGALPRSMGDTLRARAAGDLTPYEAVLRAWGFYARIAPGEHAEVRDIIERAVEQANTNGDLWALLSTLYLDEYRNDFNPRPAPLDRALRAARRAVDLTPSNHFAYYALASVLFFRRDLAAFTRAAERAIALNPMDANSVAYMGSLMAYGGDWTRGLELVDRARALNPHHPGWFWFAHFSDAYRRRDYAAALDAAVRVNMPDYYWAAAMRSAAHGQLGQREAAADALRELLTLSPGFARIARDDLEKWYVEKDVADHVLEGFRKAGLEIADTPPDQPAGEREASPNRSGSRAAAMSAKTTDAAVAIAVLPFADMSPAQDQQYLCEGMAEEIMHALVPMRGIRVASRTSTFRARHDYGDLPAIARALSVNHVLEGSVRTAGSRLRVTAQLTDIASGYQIWSSRFDRETADVFAIQDDIAAGVVDAVKSRLAPGEHAAHNRVRTENLDAYRSYLKGRHLRGKEDHAGALHAFQEAVTLDPSHAPSWTGLAEIMVLSSVFNIMPPRDACDAARKALKTAASLQGESADGWHVEAFACWIERRWDAMETAWRRALEIEPRHVLALGSFGAVLCTRQRFEEAVPILDRAREADPLASFPYALTGCGYLDCGRLREAERYLEDALSFEKEDVTALYALAMTKVALGNVTEGIALAERAVTLSHRGGVLVGILGWALAAAGRTSEALVLLDELQGRPVDAPTVVAEAWLLGGLGGIDRAFDVLARAEDECQAYLYFTGSPVFDSLRADPRFAALLGRLGLPAA